MTSRVNHLIWVLRILSLDLSEGFLAIKQGNKSEVISANWACPGRRTGPHSHIQIMQMFMMLHFCCPNLRTYFANNSIAKNQIQQTVSLFLVNECLLSTSYIIQIFCEIAQYYYWIEVSATVSAWSETKVSVESFPGSLKAGENEGGWALATAALLSKGALRTWWQRASCSYPWLLQRTFLLFQQCGNNVRTDLGEDDLAHCWILTWVFPLVRFKVVSWICLCVDKSDPWIYFQVNWINKWVTRIDTDALRIISGNNAKTTGWFASHFSKLGADAVVAAIVEGAHWVALAHVGAGGARHHLAMYGSPDLQWVRGDKYSLALASVWADVSLVCPESVSNGELPPLVQARGHRTVGRQTDCRAIGENTTLVWAVVCCGQRCSWIIFHKNIFDILLWRLFGWRSFYRGARGCSGLLLMTSLVGPPTVCSGSHLILTEALCDVAEGSTSIVAPTFTFSTVVQAPVAFATTWLDNGLFREKHLGVWFLSCGSRWIAVTSLVGPPAPWRCRFYLVAAEPAIGVAEGSTPVFASALSLPLRVDLPVATAFHTGFVVTRLIRPPSFRGGRFHAVLTDPKIRVAEGATLVRAGTVSLSLRVDLPVATAEVGNASTR